MEEKKYSFLDKIKNTPKKKMIGAVIEVAVIVIIFYLIFNFLVGVAPVKGNSMYPSLNDGDYVFYTRMDKQFYKGDIAIINTGANTLYIKRIVGVPGDTLDVKDNKLYVNGREESERYLFDSRTMTVSGGVSFPVTLGEDEYFVLGDNREDSDDSRHFGVVTSEQLQGKIQYYFGRVY